MVGGTDPGFNPKHFEEISKKLDQLKESIGTDDVRKMIVETEDGLRDLIDSTLTRKYGSNWEKDTRIGWGKGKVKELENRRDTKKQKFPEQTIPNRLLDHGYVGDLKFLIEKNEDDFKSIFSDIRRILQYLAILTEHRNPIMHTEQEVESYQKHLCLGVCGFMKQTLEKWKLGYRRMAKGWEADIRIWEPRSTNEEESKTKIQTKITDLISKLKNKSDGTIQEKDENGQKIITLPFNKKDVTIEISRLREGNYGKHGVFDTVNIHFTSADYDTLVEILTGIPYKYWTFRWVIPDGLDAIETITSIQRIRQMRHSGSSSLVNGQLTGLAINHYLQNNDERAVRVDISGGTNTPTTITMVYGGAGPHAGFTHAHVVFTPDEILEAVYGERTPNEIIRLIEDACRERTESAN